MTRSSRAVIQSLRPSQPLNTTTTTTSAMETAERGGRRRVSRQTGGSPAECPVCLTCFNGSVQRPRTLPCGHTVCTLCIDQLKVQGCVVCPECRVSHAVPEGGHFPICYAVEALIRMMRDTEVTPAAAASPPSGTEEGEGAAAGEAGQEEATGISQRMLSFLQEQEATVVDAITACQEAQSQLDQYKTTLAGWREQQQQLEDRFLGLSRNARELLEQQEAHAEVQEEELKNGEQRLQAMLERLHTLATDQEAGLAIPEVLQCTGKAEQLVEECRECFPDASTVTTARKVREASSAALEAAEEAQETPSTEEPKPQADPDSTIMDRLRLILEPSLTPKALLSLAQPARHLVEAGRVVAVHQVEGLLQHARLSLEAGQLYLHALKDLPPPPGMVTLQLSEVVPSSPPCTVFLDLSWPGSAPRRVQIRLSPNTPRGRQFLLLCTGQRGPSYIKTRMFMVKNWGKAGERVYCGDYERNDGTGSCVLLPDLDEGVYRESHKAGAVYGAWWGENGKFGILTRSLQDDVLYLVFGEVVDGLHVVAEAVQHLDIKEVTVADCGVVLRG